MLIDIEMTNTGNTLLAFDNKWGLASGSYPNEITCNPSAGPVAPGSTVTCSLSVIATQSDLDNGSIMHYIFLTGSANPGIQNNGERMETTTEEQCYS
jgi:hypothetical protein